MTIRQFDPTRLHVVFVISTLGRGGSERQMINLAAELNQRGHQAEIVVLNKPGPMADEARDRGVLIRPLSRSGRNLSSLLALVRYVRRTHPDIVHPYLPRDNALVTLLKPFIRRSRLIWGVRSSDVEWRKYGRSRSLLWRTVVYLSRWADLVIANSHYGARIHLAQGFSHHMVVIPNGIDTNVFRPDPDLRNAARSEWSVPPNTRVIGMLGRFDPMKGHDRILEVFEIAQREHANLHLVVVGLHTADEGRRFLKEARDRGLEGHVSLLGESTSPTQALNGFDVLVLPSVSEAFPNVVAEALSCGVKVAAFDVGDAKEIVSNFGSVVPRGDTEALAKSVLWVLESQHDSDVMHGYVERTFGVAALADRSLEAFRSLLSGRQGR